MWCVKRMICGNVKDGIAVNEYEALAKWQSAKVEKRAGTINRLCGLVVRVSGYRSRGPGFDFQSYQIFWEVGGLEQGQLSLMRTTEQLLEWKSSGSGLETQD
jgi:hypothetical protein